MFFKHFFRLKYNVYLDNNATTKVSRVVVNYMEKVLRNYYGNPSSLYKKATYSAIILDNSRRMVAENIGAEPEEITFTGSATEANNAVIKMLAEKHPVKRKILSSPVEHSSIISTLEYLSSRGYEICYIPLTEKGVINPAVLENLIDSNTFLICCMYANNETGVIQDIKAISEIGRKKNVPVLADCVQALGKIPVNVKDLGVEYASFSAHKIHGPKGVGALYVKKGTYISPFIHGGHQEGGLRAGTESLHNIAGFSKAVQQISSSIKAYKKIDYLRKYFISRILKIKPDAIMNSPVEENVLPNTMNITFTGINNAYFIATLDYFNISVSAGSACNTQSNEPSHVLKAIGLTDQQARESIRFSFGTDTKKWQTDYTLGIIRDFISNKLPQIGMVEPKVLNREFIFDPNNYILDVRFWHDRLLVKSIPKSIEIPFFTFKNYLKQVPKDKNIIVVCQGGYNSPVVAYEMKYKGFTHVSFLSLGILGWKQTFPELYNELGGTEINKLYNKKNAVSFN